MTPDQITGLVLNTHIVVGTAGLVLGPVYLLARRRRWRRRLGFAYQGVMAAVVITAAGLSLLNFAELWWLLPIGLASEAMAVVGVVARRRAWIGWPSWTAHLLGGSYIALVTAFLVVRTGHPIFWVLPALVGQVPIAVAKRRLAGQKAREQAGVGLPSIDPRLDLEVERSRNSSITSVSAPRRVAKQPVKS